MLAFDNKYSHFVFLAKIFLPILALLLLSSVFLLSKYAETEKIIAITSIGSNVSSSNQKISSPIYSGLTEDGSELSFSSQSISPSLLNPKVILANTVLARLETSLGKVYNVSAKKGRYNENTSTVDLSGNVIVQISDGYRFYTNQLSTHVKKTLITSPGSITGDGPLGFIEAGQMVISQIKNKHLLTFKNGVKLTTTPNK